MRVRSVIIQKRSLLLIRRQKNGHEYWVFPGGGVHKGETKELALKREALEELGVIVTVDKLFTIYEPGSSREQVFYFCSIVGGQLGTGEGPEFQKGTHYEGMYTLEWIPLEEIPKLNILPDAVKVKILEEVGL